MKMPLRPLPLSISFSVSRLTGPDDVSIPMPVDITTMVVERYDSIENASAAHRMNSLADVLNSTARRTESKSVSRWMPVRFLLLVSKAAQWRAKLYLIGPHCGFSSLVSWVAPHVE